jgi:hypothetical protein
LARPKDLAGAARASVVSSWTSLTAGKILRTPQTIVG